MSPHRHIRVLALLATGLSLLAGCASTGSPALSWSGDRTPLLSHWLDGELAPYLSQTLTTHPRFKGETISVMAVRGDESRPAADELSARLERRIIGQLLSVDGIRVVRDEVRGAGECLRREDAHYLLAVDLQQSSPASHRLSVRALDREDGTWVSGFGREWEGRLTRSEYASFKRKLAGTVTSGRRSDPFRSGESDLLAERLAADLGERLCGFVGEPLAVFADTGGETVGILADTVSLVANNLARSPHIRVVDDRSAATLILSGRLYRVDGELHQLWVQARPASGTGSFAVADVEAYVSVPDTLAFPDYPDSAAGTGALSPSSHSRPQTPVVAALRILTPSEPWMCRRSDPWRLGGRILPEGEALPAEDCFALEVETVGEADVFLLRQTPGAGLQRLMPSPCAVFAHPPSGVQRRDKLRFPDPESGRSHVLLPQAGSSHERLFAVAVPSTAAAESLREHLQRVPDTCAGEGYESADAARWLARLRRLDTEHEAGIGFRSREIALVSRRASLE